MHLLNIVIEKRMGFGLDDGEMERIGREYRCQRGIATQRNEITDSRKVDIHKRNLELIALTVAHLIIQL